MGAAARRQTGTLNGCSVSRLSNHWSWFARIPGRLKAVAIIVALASSYVLVLNTEPRGPQLCENVRVLGTVKCGRGGQCFMVRYLQTGQQRTVGTFVDKPFAVDYVGPASLLTRRGEWTGAYHFEFADSCASLSNLRWSGRAAASPLIAGGNR
jgi:hypothetical protein